MLKKKQALMYPHASLEYMSLAKKRDICTHKNRVDT